MRTMPALFATAAEHAVALGAYVSEGKSRNGSLKGFNKLETRQTLHPVLNGAAERAKRNHPAPAPIHEV